MVNRTVAEVRKRKKDLNVPIEEKPKEDLVSEEEGQAFIQQREKRASQLQQGGLSVKSSQQLATEQISQEEQKLFEETNRKELVNTETEALATQQEQALQPQLQPGQRTPEQQRNLAREQAQKKTLFGQQLSLKSADSAAGAISAVLSGILPGTLKGDFADRAQKKVKETQQDLAEIREGLRFELQSVKQGNDPIEIIADLDNYAIALAAHEYRVRDLQSQVRFETLGIDDAGEVLMDIQNRKKQLALIRRAALRLEVAQSQGVAQDTSELDALIGQLNTGGQQNG